jgi:hypothetical protein
MNREYPTLYILFRSLSIFYGVTFSTYRMFTFESFVQYPIPLAEQVKLEVKAAVNDPNFRWKEYLKDEHFYQYSEDKTDQELILDFKLIFWDLFYPDEVYTEALQNELMEQTIALLKLHNATSQNSALESQVVLKELRVESSQWVDLSLYELLRMRKFKALYKIGLERKKGTDQWFFYLLPEENWNWGLEIDPYDWDEYS